MELFSHSRLDTYDSCNRRFYYKYVLEWEDVAGLPAIFGKTVHKATELCFKGCSFDDAVATAWIEEAGIPEVKRSEVEAHTQNALRHELFKGHGLVEEHFVMDLAEGVKLQGYIDRVVLNGQHSCVVDWKTGRVVQEVLDKKQTSLYAAHVLRKYNLPYVHGVLFFTRFNCMKRAVITKEIAEEAIQWAITLAKEIQGKLKYLPMLTRKEIINFAFPAKPGTICNICSWGIECLADDGK